MTLLIGCSGFPMARRRYFERFCLFNNMAMAEDAARFRALTGCGVHRPCSEPGCTDNGMQRHLTGGKR